MLQMDSVFRVLEPVVERITEKAKSPGGFGRFAFGNTRSEWFRIFRVSLLVAFLDNNAKHSAGFLLAVGGIRPILPQGQNRNSMYQRLRSYGSDRVSRTGISGRLLIRHFQL